MIEVALVNFLIGNCDVHGKNFSLLYRDRGSAFAPFYALVSSTVYSGLSTKLSMRIGSEYRIDRIRADDLGAFAKDIGVKPRIIGERLAYIFEKASGAWEGIVELEELRQYPALSTGLRAGWLKRKEQVEG